MNGNDQGSLISPFMNTVGPRYANIAIKTA